MSYCNSDCNSSPAHVEENFEDLLSIAFESGVNEKPENDPMVTSSGGLSRVPATSTSYSSRVLQKDGEEEVDLEVAPYDAGVEFENLLRMVGLIEDATPLLEDDSCRTTRLVEKGLDSILSSPTTTTTTDKYSFCVRKGMNFYIICSLFVH